jgi:predicted N-formylglutamate amidohydrolase
VVGENEPYRIEPGVHDYTVPVHGDARGLDAALIEVRQDLLADAAEIEAWALRLASALGVAAGRSP